MLILVIAAFTGLTGCGSLKYPKAHRDKISKEFQSYSYTADLRATHVVKKGDRYWILSEPPPDVAFAFEDEEAFNIDLSLISVGESGGEKEGMMAGSEDLPLTGRSSYVVFARELFYRVNEMAFNTDATYDQYMDAMDKAFNIIEDVAELEAANIKHSAQVHINTGVSASQSLKESATDTQQETTSSKTESSAVTPNNPIVPEANDAVQGAQTGVSTPLPVVPTPLPAVPAPLPEVPTTLPPDVQEALQEVIQGAIQDALRNQNQQ